MQAGLCRSQVGLQAAGFDDKHQPQQYKAFQPACRDLLRLLLEVTKHSVTGSALACRYIRTRARTHSF